MLITNGGTLVRTKTDEISVLSRNTQGVRVIRLKTDERLIAVERVIERDAENVADAIVDTESGSDSEGPENNGSPSDD